jgi:hypothetical protein
MKYNNALGGQKYNPNTMPSGDTTTLGLTGDISPAPPMVSTPRTMYNPGIKPSGAPVNFNPKEQANMTGMFGMPSDGSYDRTMNTVIDASTMEKPTY